MRHAQTLPALFIMLAAGVGFVLSKPLSSIRRYDLGPEIESENAVLDTRQDVSIITINPPNLLTPIFDYLKSLQSNKTPDTKVQVQASSSSQTAVQMLRDSLASLYQYNVAQHNGLNAVAVRFGVLQFPIALDGIPGQDYGHDLITMTASDGTSLWDFYWVKTGKITVTTSNFDNDVVLGANEFLTPDPTNPNRKTITLVTPPPG